MPLCGMFGRCLATEAESVQAYLEDCIPSAMTHSVNLRKTKHKPEEACKAFEDISKYFSREEWAKLSHSEKITYVYMKRNYTTMTNLGLRAHLPDFMESNEQATKSVLNDSDEVFSHESQGLRRRPVSIWSHRLRERKKQVIYEEISDPEDEKEEREEEKIEKGIGGQGGEGERGKEGRRKNTMV
eukprot:XP_017457720.1 PREDICTED: protein SSX1 isoform X1 [Rattus norvegicus]